MKFEKEMKLASIIKGKHAGQYGNIMVEFIDGECIIDLGGDKLVYEETSNLRYWTNVKSLEVKDGKVVDYELA